MTQQELKEFLFHSMRLRGNHLPNYHIDLYFECEVLVLDEFERFIDEVQALLTTGSLGEVLLFGIDENQKAGNIVILCSDPRKIRLTFGRIKPLVEKVEFFEYGYGTLVILTKSGGYKKDGELIGRSHDPREDMDELEVHLPIPKGVKLPSGNSFLAFLSKLFSR